MRIALLIAALASCRQEEEPKFEKLPAEFKAEAEQIARDLADEAGKRVARDVASKAGALAKDPGSGDTCTGGNCTQTCAAGKTCTLACPGGNCRQTCEQGSTCELTCAGGNCTQRCDGPCKKSCAGDHCT